MTRYTKLEGRRAIPSGNDTADATKYVESRSEESQDPSNSTKVEQDTAQLDPKKLLKRSKLLRLKAKKAKSDEVRDKLLSDSKKMEKMVAKANGARGASGKRQAGAKEPAHASRLGLGMFLLPSYTDPNQRRAFRRAKRAEERQTNMRCFVCRELSHSAKDCPQRVGDGAQGKDTVGICFRCGSTEHTLSQCKRARNPDDELPFATCYICTNKVCRMTRSLT